MSKKVLMGLDNFHYSLLTADTTATLTYATPVALKGAINVAVNPNSEVATLFADDGPYDTAESIGAIEVDVSIADVSQEDYAALLGHTITAGVLNELTTDQPPDVAFGFRALRSNSAYSYIWLLKGKFSKPDVKHETKGEKLSFQTLTFKGRFVQLINNGRYKSSTRSDATDYSAVVAAAWFTSVYGTSPDTTAPTYSTSAPASGSVTADITAVLTVTFSEPILASTAIAANFAIIQATAGFSVPISTVSVASATVTLTHSVLSASGTYNLVIGMGVKDLAGNAMTGAYTVKFTCGA